MFFAVANLLNLEVDLLFFDTTSTYFERDSEDDGDGFRRYGHCKGSGVFQVKILSATVTDGKAEVSSAAKDKNPGNNTAAIKVTVVTGAPGGGTGGGSGLPITGAQVGLIGALGLGAVVIGAVLLV